jgi:hypothetical protein
MCFDVLCESRGAVIIESGAIDQCLVFRESKHARLRIARLRMIRDRARLDGSET